MPRIEFRCTDKERELYVHAAGLYGQSLSEWIRSRLADPLVSPGPVQVGSVGSVDSGRVPSGVASVLAKRFG